MPDSREGSFLKAFYRAVVLSILIGWIPFIGGVIAGFVAGRAARRPAVAFVAALLPAALWCAGLSLFNFHFEGIKQNVDITGLRFLGPVQAALILGGALLGSQPGARLLGVLAIVFAICYTGVKVNEFVGLIRGLAAIYDLPKYEPQKNKSCPENLKELYKALQTYADDWDGGLPPADRWMTLIKDKVPRDEWLRCPAAPSGKSGYSMNPTLGGKKLNGISDRATRPLLYDSADLDADAHSGPESMPKPGRHMGRNNVLFADGTVRQQ